MKHYYAVKDLAVQAFGIPFQVRAEGEAMRSFQDEVNGKGSENSAIAAHPEDYELYKLGTFDDVTGELKGHTPQLVARAKELLVSKP